MNLNFKVFLLLSLFCFFISLAADTEPKEVNVPLNALKSAIVPGWGELRVKDNMGFAFIAAEVATWSAMFYFKEEANLRMKKSQQFAHNNANLTDTKLDNDMWYLLSRYNHSGYGPGGYMEMVVKEAYARYPHYNQAKERTEYINANKLDDDFSWDWGNRENRVKYRVLRKESREQDDYALAVSGLIFVNHIVSLLHTVNTTKNYNKRITMQTFIDSELNPNITFCIKL
ncbi:MAG: hypothetical protein FWG20_02945 [Candidatus Cloacimonetes bacterium]|nr:hypothetical protein [Candidatus Cloacimonadota bacterium]